MSFGAGTRTPGFAFSQMEISFDLLNDRIPEGTEVGELTIAPDPTNFDGHAPLFKSVRITIRDDEGKINDIDYCNFIACSGAGRWRDGVYRSTVPPICAVVINRHSVEIHKGGRCIEFSSLLF